MIIDPKRRGFITGKTQVGKSELAKYIIKQIKNWLIYDTKHEYEGGAIVHDMKGLSRAFAAGCNRVIFRPDGVYLTEEGFSEVCKFVYYNLKNITFIVDEMQEYCSKHKIPLPLKSIITVGEGKKHIGFIAISQRPQNVHNDILSNISWLISLRILLPEDAKYMAPYMHVNEKDLLSLPKYHYIMFNDREELGKEIQRFKPIKV